MAFLILGTSHAGKSTFAATLAARLGTQATSTDQMGRHPGRPWTGVPPAVLEFYGALSDDAILWFLRVHHQNLRPHIGAWLDRAAPHAVLEGAALRPEFLEGWGIPASSALCLTAPEDVLEARIHRSSGYAQQPPEMRSAIDRFVTRSLAENAAFAADAAPCGVRVVDSEKTPAGSLLQAALDAISQYGWP